MGRTLAVCPGTPWSHSFCTPVAFKEPLHKKLTVTAIYGKCKQSSGRCVSLQNLKLARGDVGLELEASHSVGNTPLPLSLQTLL